jgi:hypothetical protein
MAHLANFSVAHIWRVNFPNQFGLSDLDGNPVNDSERISGARHLSVEPRFCIDD